MSFFCLHNLVYLFHFCPSLDMKISAMQVFHAEEDNFYHNKERKEFQKEREIHFKVLDTFRQKLLSLYCS